MTSKKIALDVLRQLPDDATSEEIMSLLDARYFEEAGGESETDTAWAKVIQRRAEEIRAGISSAVPAKESFLELRETYG